MCGVPEHGGPPFSFAVLYRAYLDCRRGKGNSEARWRFEAHLERNLIELADELRTRRYQPGPSVCFVSDQPKRREIFAAAFRDRVVHHLLVGQIAPWWERRFIHDSYACRPGKGTMAAVERTQQFLRQVTGNGSRRAWTMHLDIRSFFVRIDKQILCRVIEAGLERQALPWAGDLAWLVRCVVLRDPSSDAHRIGGGFAAVPRHKSLYGTHNRTGLPIGNYTSQFFANAYLDGLDQFVKHGLRQRYYLRYVDDLILMDASRDRLLELEGAIVEYLREQRALELNPAVRRLLPASNGLDALGYVVRHSHLLLRRRTTRRLRGILGRARAVMRSSHLESLYWRLSSPSVERLLAQCMSYRGLLARAASLGWVRRIEQEHAWVERLWRLGPRGRVRRRLAIAGRPGSLAVQWRLFKRLAGRDVCVLMQVGCYWEAFGRDADWLCERLGLKPARRRPGLPRGCGIPARLLPRYRARLLQSECPVVWVGQQPGWRGATRSRRIVALLEPAGLAQLEAAPWLLPPSLCSSAALARRRPRTYAERGRGDVMAGLARQSAQGGGGGASG